MKSEEGGSFCSVFVISLLWVLLRDTSELYHEYMYNIPCEVAIILGFLQYILNEDYVCMHVCITSSFGEKYHIASKMMIFNKVPLFFLKLFIWKPSVKNWQSVQINQW